MTAEDKKNYLNKLRAKEEFDKLNKDLSLDEGESKLKKLKNEVVLMDRQK